MHGGTAFREECVGILLSDEIAGTIMAMAFCVGFCKRFQRLYPPLCFGISQCGFRFEC